MNHHPAWWTRSKEALKVSKDYGILVDVGSCLGCGVCVTACKQENDLPPYIDDRPGTIGLAWNQVLSISEGVYPDLSRHYLHVHCMHCAVPPCVPACPKEAISKREEDGVVLIAKSRCDACVDQPEGIKKCIPACPYGAIQFSEEKNVVEACTLCVHRIDADLEPACVRACIARCLTFGDLNNPDSQISQKITEVGDRVFVLKPEEGSRPSIRYIAPEGIGAGRVSCLDKTAVMYGFKKQPHV